MGKINSYDALVDKNKPTQNSMAKNIIKKNADLIHQKQTDESFPQQKINNFIHNQYHSPSIPFTHVKLWHGPDWNRNLQALVASYDEYRREFNQLLECPPSLLRSAEGLYPDYGQYENVPNSGWSYYAPKSLNQQNALSVSDKIAYGIPIGNIHPSVAVGSEEKAKEVADLFNKEGGINYDNFDKYSNQFNKTLLKQLENYVDYDGLATKSDDISRLAYTQLKSWFDSLKIILDDKKLTEFTGIPNDISNEINAYVKKRLLPDPIEEGNKGKGASLWTEDENKIGNDLKTAQRFGYIKKYLLDTPTQIVDSPDSLFHDSPKSVLNPYDGMSDVAKAMLSVRKNQIDKYLSTLPYDKADTIRKELHNPEFLGKYPQNKSIYNDVSSMQGVLPDSYKKYDSNFFKSQQASLAVPQNAFRDKASNILNDMNVSDMFYQRKNLGLL